jgi:hypothetical protein
MTKKKRLKLLKQSLRDACRLLKLMDENPSYVPPGAMQRPRLMNAIAQLSDEIKLLMRNRKKQ